MKYIYAAFALLSFFLGLLLLLLAASAVQQIEGLIALLIGAVFMVAAEISELSAALRAAPADAAAPAPAEPVITPAMAERLRARTAPRA